jgi:hypothetical protein
MNGDVGARDGKDDSIISKGVAIDMLPIGLLTKACKLGSLEAAATSARFDWKVDVKVELEREPLMDASEGASEG